MFNHLILTNINLSLDLNAFIDAAHGEGKLLSIEAEYDIGNGFEVSLGMTKIFGRI